MMLTRRLSVSRDRVCASVCPCPSNMKRSRARSSARRSRFIVSLGLVSSKRYDAALVVEMRSRGISFQRELTVPVLYRGVEVGLHRLDLLVANQVVLELKAVKEISRVHFAVVRSYLRAVDRKHGLILNFAKSSLEAKRVFASRDPSCISCIP